jgi:hypothetical protein
MPLQIPSSPTSNGTGSASHWGGTVVTEHVNPPAQAYVWRSGRVEVVVELDGEGWRVVSSSAGRLFGPREKLYEARHKLARHAAWDVMACVIRATRNEDEGVAAGRAAARWMVARRPTE